MDSIASIFDGLALFFQQGGAFMWVIIILWGIGFAIAVERFIRLFFFLDTDGPSFMNEIQRYVLSNDIAGSIRACSGTTAAMPRVLKNGLKRAGESMEQVQNALDATALELIPKIEKRVSSLQLFANVSTLFGLLGTIQGLINSFGAVAQADPAQKAELLASGISQAMNTTALGLFSAITLLMLHGFISSKADKIINEIDEFSVKLLDLLGTRKNKNS